MNRVTFRVDMMDDVCDDDVRSFFEKYTDITKYLIYKEEADITKKIHYQGVMYSSVSATTLRNRVSRFFKRSGQQYSCKIVKDDNYEVYITKDKCRICSEGYSDIEIQALEEKSYKVVHKKEEDSRAKYFRYMSEKFDSTLVQRTRKDQVLYIGECVTATTDYFSNIVERGYGQELVKQHVNSWLCKTDKDYRFKFISQVTDFISHNIV